MDNQYFLNFSIKWAKNIVTNKCHRKLVSEYKVTYYTNRPSHKKYYKKILKKMKIELPDKHQFKIEMAKWHPEGNLCYILIRPI